MSRPVLRLPGTFYLLTRRVHRRELRLLPGQSFEGAVGVLIAKAARAAGLVVTHLVVMSNHVHAVFWDPEGRVTDFMKEALGGIAKVANYVQEQRGHFWEQDDGEALKALRDLGAVEDAVVYSYCNPSAAGLVARPSAWPGVNTRLEDIGSGRAVVFERSAEYFRKGGPVPMAEELVLGLPEFVDAEAFRSRVQAAAKKKLAAIHAKMRSEGRSFLGRAAILAAGTFDVPATEEPRGRAERVEREAARDPEVERHAVERLVDFELRYRECARLIGEGVRDVVLPAGSYHLWRHRGFQRQEPPPPEQIFKAA